MDGGLNRQLCLQVHGTKSTSMVLSFFNCSSSSLYSAFSAHFAFCILASWRSQGLIHHPNTFHPVKNCAEKYTTHRPHPVARVQTEKDYCQLFFTSLPLFILSEPLPDSFFSSVIKMRQASIAHNNDNFKSVSSCRASHSLHNTFPKTQLRALTGDDSTSRVRQIPVLDLARYKFRWRSTAFDIQ